ncbi:MAG: DUF222 domain-containing protein [Acidimicrobiia bacterium]
MAGFTPRSFNRSGAPLPSASLRLQLLAVGRWCTQSQRKLVLLAAELDRSGEWAIDGSRTCAHWIAMALDVEVCTAREWLRIGRALGNLPVIDRAFADGRLSYSKVRALTRVAKPEHEAVLHDLALRTPAGQLRSALAAWLLGHETPEETERRQHDARGLSWHVDPDGTVVGTFRLPGRVAAPITAAIDTWVVRHRPSPGSTAERAMDASVDASRSRSEVESEDRRDTHGGWPSIAQQRADALVELVRGGGTSVETEVVLHVRGDGCAFDDGTPIASSVVERIAPESFLRVLVHDADSRPVNASGRHRHPTARQRRIVRERDRVCVDCGASELLEFDHEPPFEQTGRTVVDELRLRCWACHRARHRGEGAA